MSEREWDDEYDAQLEERQEDWMAEKRGERRCTTCAGTGNTGYLREGRLDHHDRACPLCRGTGFVPVSVLGADTPATKGE